MQCDPIRRAWRQEGKAINLSARTYLSIWEKAWVRDLKIKTETLTKHKEFISLVLTHFTLLANQTQTPILGGKDELALGNEDINP